LRKLLLTTLSLAAVGGGVIGTAVAEPRDPKKDKMGYGEKISHKIGKHIQGTHYCQEKLDNPKTKVRMLFTQRSVKYRRYVLGVWIDRHDNWCDKYRAAKKRFAEYGALGSLNCVSCWLRVASCESGQRWDYNGSSGFDGGLQFLPSTWLGYGGGKYAPYAYQATAMQQISIASHMSLSHWPVCGARY
jgi:Transglycosylase-like domain